MVFSSVEFLAYFLPIFLIVYYIAGDKSKNAVLLIGSLIFYAYGEAIYIALMLFSIMINHYLAFNIFDLQAAYFKDKRYQIKRKIYFVAAIVYNLGILFVFKYFNFFGGIVNDLVGSKIIPESSLTLPIGISFYTFQIMSYVIDVYRKKYEATQNFVSFATYVTMFPQLIAGPIVNFDEVSGAMESRKLKMSDIEVGMGYFILGLASKVLLANKIASLWNSVQTVGALGVDTPTAWLGAYGFTMQIYFDFFGYSLMAIGLGRMLGFTIPVNFINPYCTTSATQFWRNWHITLGRWFRAYVYIPLGGNRKGTARLIFNLFVVWFLTGLWHGASMNFVVWGLIFFAVLAAEKLFYGRYVEKYKLLGHVYMMILIPASWVIFSVTDFKEMGLFLAKMFFIPLGEGGVGIGVDKFATLFSTYWWLLAVCVLCCTPWPLRLFEKYGQRWYAKIVLGLLFIYSAYQVSIGGDNPFLYFRF